MFFADRATTPHFATSKMQGSPAQCSKRCVVHINWLKTAVSEANLDTYHALYVCRSVMMINNGTGAQSGQSRPIITAEGAPFARTRRGLLSATQTGASCDTEGHGPSASGLCAYGLRRTYCKPRLSAAPCPSGTGAPDRTACGAGRCGGATCRTAATGVV